MTACFAISDFRCFLRGHREGVLTSREHPLFHVRFVLRQSLFDEGREVDILFDELWREPFKKAYEIVVNQHLTVTLLARADADRRNPEIPGDSGGHKIRDTFHDNHEDPRTFEVFCGSHLSSSGSFRP